MSDQPDEPKSDGPGMPEGYDEEDLCALLGISPATARRYRKRAMTLH